MELDPALAAFRQPNQLVNALDQYTKSRGTLIDQFANNGVSDRE